MAENQQNMDKVKELMEQAKEVNAGGEASARVEIDYASEYGTHFRGYVKFKRPTMRDFMKMGGAKAEILRLAGVHNPKLVDNSVMYTAHVMAVLSVVITEAPEWLADVENVEEVDVLYHVHDKYEEWERSFRKSVQK